MALFAFAASEHAVLGKDICSDTYVSENIQPFATPARSAIGICSTAKAGVAFYTENLRLVQQCLSDPGYGHISSIWNDFCKVRKARLQHHAAERSERVNSLISLTECQQEGHKAPPVVLCRFSAGLTERGYEPFHIEFRNGWRQF